MKILLEKLNGMDGCSASGVTDEDAAEYSGNGVILTKEKWAEEGVPADACNIVNGDVVFNAFPRPIRDALKRQSLVDLEAMTVDISGRVFDAPESSQSAYATTIKHFDVRAVADFPSGDGSLVNWTLADDSRVPVTLAELQEVLDTAEKRALALSAAYRDAKAEF